MLRISELVCLFLIRSFLGSFVFRHLLESTHHTFGMSLYAIMWVQIWSRAIEPHFFINTHFEKPISFCSNSLVFQNYMLRFWRDCYLILIRSFPGSFGVQAHPRRWYTARLLFCVKNTSHIFWWVKKGSVMPLLRWLKIQKTPEMNDLDCASKSLKSGAPNFEKQKNDSILKILGEKKLFSPQKCQRWAGSL